MRPFPAQSRLDLCLTVGVQLGAVGAEHLDAVVGRRVVTGRHHQAPGCSDPADQQRHCRGRAQAKGPDVAPCCREAGRQGRHQHAAAAAGVHADQNRTLLLEHLTHPVAHLQRESWGQHGSGLSTDSIGAETRNGGAKAGADRRHGALNH